MVSDEESKFWFIVALLAICGLPLHHGSDWPIPDMFDVGPSTPFSFSLVDDIDPGLVEVVDQTLKYDHNLAPVLEDWMVELVGVGSSLGVSKQS